MQINLIAVILAAVSAFFLGFIWYTVVFAKVWQKEIGMKVQTDASETPDLGKLLIGSFILEIIMAFVLARLIGSEADWLYGLGTGLMVGIGAVGLAFGVNYMYEGKSLRLWLINAGYNAVVFGVMGLIIGAL